jgi:ATP-dependent helicase/nuclease subunit A
VPRELAEEKLVTLECRQAAAWIAAQLAAGVQPQQIMVLARRRDRLAAMEEQLRLLRIPAQQPEKTSRPCSTRWCRRRTTCRWRAP